MILITISIVASKLFFVDLHAQSYNQFVLKDRQFTRDKDLASKIVRN